MLKCSSRRDFVRLLVGADHAAEARFASSFAESAMGAATAGRCGWHRWIPQASFSARSGYPVVRFSEEKRIGESLTIRRFCQTRTDRGLHPISRYDTLRGSAQVVCVVDFNSISPFQ